MLAVHSATGFSGYAASDRVPERIAAMVYVDTAPGQGAAGPRLRGRREAHGLGGHRGGGEPRRAQRGAEGDVPAAGRAVPGGLLREAIALTNDARRDIPSTLICTGFTAEQYQDVRQGRARLAFLAGIPELRNVDLDRPADEPLADVVAPEGARRDHRRRREGARPRRPARVAQRAPLARAAARAASPRR